MLFTPTCLGRAGAETRLHHLVLNASKGKEQEHKHTMVLKAAQLGMGGQARPASTPKGETRHRRRRAKTEWWDNACAASGGERGSAASWRPTYAWACEQTQPRPCAKSHGPAPLLATRGVWSLFCLLLFVGGGGGGSLQYHGRPRVAGSRLSWFKLPRQAPCRCLNLLRHL